MTESIGNILNVVSIEGGLRLEIASPSGELLSVNLVGDGARDALISMYSCLEDPEAAGLDALDQQPAVFLLDPQVSGKLDEASRLHLAFKGKGLPPFRVALDRRRMAAMLSSLLNNIVSPKKSH
ncbi:hypothetical protein GB927_007680 [Shinella sp. CPCC 100929]|uniref:Uncharacterized protein n=1 Tax=Shinella lacus TaxID=2654216 RepID=A0ABT1R3Z9_9HYPH|nr:hypothetical protein [Shinella lacus]MCQ4629907.1 hypothetical protein [Shinella lacus]